MMVDDLLPQADPWEFPKFDLLARLERRSASCLVIPVINEGERIQKQLLELQPFSSLVDIIVADGGSTDGSLGSEILQQANVRAVLTKFGPGKLSAQLRMAYAWALTEGYENFLTMDGNGKDGVDAIPSFVEMLNSGIDYVQGSRFVRGGQAINTPRFRYMAIRAVHAPLVSLAARRWYTDTTNGFRGYSRRLLQSPEMGIFRNIFSGYELLPYVARRAARKGFRICEIPVVRSYPKSGSTPTKLHPVGGSVELMKVLSKNLFGRYDP